MLGTTGSIEQRGWEGD
ncbi:hypothetical protein A2U01_0102440, partial [Trifolium medium]|nr:hypothetical protein [Trifolium medium]